MDIYLRRTFATFSVHQAFQLVKAYFRLSQRAGSAWPNSPDRESGAEGCIDKLWGLYMRPGLCAPFNSVYNPPPVDFDIYKLGDTVGLKTTCLFFVNSRTRDWFYVGQLSHSNMHSIILFILVSSGLLRQKSWSKWDFLWHRAFLLSSVQFQKLPLEFLLFFCHRWSGEKKRCSNTLEDSG